MELNWPLPGAPVPPSAAEPELAEVSVLAVSSEREHPDRTASRPITRPMAMTRRCVVLTWFPLSMTTSPEVVALDESNTLLPARRDARLQSSHVSAEHALPGEAMTTMKALQVTRN